MWREKFQWKLILKSRDSEWTTKWIAREQMMEEKKKEEQENAIK